MGLDTVDIVINIEKKLGIALPNTQLEKVLTVGELHNVVWQNLTVKEGTKCKSQIVFYKLRRHFTATSELPRQYFTTGLSLNNMLPVHNRKLVYAAVAEDIQLQLPNLALTPRWSSFLTNLGLATIGGGLALSLILINFFNYSKWYLLIPCAGIALSYILSSILNVKRTVIEQPTVRDFVNETVAMNYAVLANQTGTNRKEIEYLINQIISDISGIEIHEITPIKKIGDDLGID